MIVANLLLLGFIFILPSQPAAPALEFEKELVVLDDLDFCPGDVLEFTNTFMAHEPTVVEIVATVLDLETGMQLSGETTKDIPRLLPYEETRELTIKWVVPDIPPGQYQRISGATSMNMGTAPAFVVVPFNVKENCVGE